MGTSDDVEIACSLSAADQVARTAAWADLLAHALDRHRVEGGWRLAFPADPPLVGQLADLAVREQQCCAFFSFAIVINSGDQVDLEARAPDAARPLLDELIAAS
jgi:hypothetical protein